METKMYNWSLGIDEIVLLLLLHGYDVPGESDDDEFDDYAAPAVFNKDKFLLRDTGITSALLKLGDQAVTFTTKRSAATPKKKLILCQKNIENGILVDRL